MEAAVTVCIPTYNGAEFLRPCLESVLDQTVGDIKVLVVDDGSTDDTVAIAKEYAAADRRLRVERNETRQGLVGNWNRCIERCDTEWIKFVFQDDLIAPTCVEALLDVSVPDVHLAVCRRDVRFEATDPDFAERFTRNLQENSLDVLFEGRHHIDGSTFCAGLLRHLEVSRLKNFIGEPTAVMIRRDAFSRVGRFNPHLIQIADFEMCARIAVESGLAYCSDTLATFRVHGGAESARNAELHAFRARVLDRLVVLHDFAYHPAYEPLRRTVIDRGERGSLARRTRMRALRVQELIERVRGDARRRPLVDEWQAVVSHYPRLRRSRIEVLGLRTYDGVRMALGKARPRINPRWDVELP